MERDLFRDVDDLTDLNSEDSADMYPKRKSQAEKDLEKELQKDKKEMEEPKKAKKMEGPKKKKYLTKNDSIETKQPTEIKSEKPTKKVSDKKTDVEKNNNKVKETPENSKKEKAPQESKKEKPKKKEPAKKVPKVEIIENDDKNNWALISASALVIVAIIVALYFAFSAVKPLEKPNTALAIVNGEPIYNSMVDFREKTLNNLGIPVVDKKELLNQIIDEKLMLQDAKKNGIKVTKEEAEEQLNKSLNSRGLELSAFRQSLEEHNISYEETINFYKNSMEINEYINKTIIPKINVSNEALLKYYESNKNMFTQPKAVTVRHLLVMFNNQTENETFEKANILYNELKKNPDNFCELVKVNTDDIASKDTCGEYTFTKKDPLVPEFLEAGFRLKPGEIELIKTQFGYHIMLKVKDIPEKIQKFSEVKDQIKTMLQQTKVLKMYDERVNELKKSAKIELYGEEKQNQMNNSTNNTKKDILESDTNKETKVTEVEKDAEVDYKISEPEKSNDKEKEMNKESSSAKSDDSKGEKSISKEELEMKNLVKCISDKAIMYTVYWSPDNEQQLKIFGKYKDLISIKECDEDKENYALECKEKNIKIYPSWEIDGELFGGLQSLVKLQKITGC